MLAPNVAVVALTAALLVASTAGASVRQWLARMTRGRTNGCRPAYVLSLNAGFAAAMGANAAIPAAAAAGDADAKLPDNAALPTRLSTWWLARSVATPHGDA